MAISFSCDWSTFQLELNLILYLKHKTIKKDFIFIVLFSSFIPFLILLVFLLLILKDSSQKIAQANAQIQHTQELEILDSFHKSMGQVYQAVQSFEMNEYFSANIEVEEFYKNKLRDYLLTLNNAIPYANPAWIILGSHGNILLSTDANEKNPQHKWSRIIGASFDKITHKIVFSLPLFYNSTNTKDRYKNIIAYVQLEIPFASVKKQYNYLKNIQNISPDLSSRLFKTDFTIPLQNNNFIYLFYFYIFIFILCNVLAVYFGIKLLQNKIINKIDLLTIRLANEIQFSSKIFKLNFSEKSYAQNEIDSLSFIFNKYMKYVQFLQYEIEKSSQLVAVGHIAHTIAHDLRKPFSHTTLFLEQVGNASNLNEVSMLAQEFKPLLQNSISYVEHLLNDIMEAGVNKLQVSHTVKLEDVILKSLENILILPSYCHVEMEYEFNLAHYLKLDEWRIVRVISNLILNALEAMNFQGKIWIHAAEKVDKNRVEIRIGNNNAFIEPEDIKYLFEPFFTKNKKSGTGLGLSIAQKIIQLHEGTISCFSEKDKGVEFVLTLPLSSNLYQSTSAMLPAILHSSQDRGLSSHSVLPRATAESTSTTSDLDKIIIIDDDPFIGRSWKRMTKDAEVVCFLYPEECLNEIKNGLKLDKNKTIIISDFNFGVNSKMDFYHFISELRTFFVGAIFLSTDALIEDLDIEFLTQQKIIKINKSNYSFFALKAKYKNEIGES